MMQIGRDTTRLVLISAVCIYYRITNQNSPYYLPVRYFNTVYHIIITHNYDITKAVSVDGGLLSLQLLPRRRSTDSIHGYITHL